MTNNKNKSMFYILSILAISITLFYGLQQSILLGYILFALLPYSILIYLIKISNHQTSQTTAQATVLFIVSVGLYFLIDSTYMEKNLGYKFSFLFIPIWQLTMLLVSGFVIYLSNEKEK